MKNWKIFLTLASVLILATVSTVFSADHNSIVDIAVSNDDFDTLAAAVVAADLVETLDGDTDFTVLAPTDAAFAKLGLNENNIATAFTKAELTDILLYHVLPGKLNSNDVTNLAGQDITMANGQKAGLKLVDSDIYINDDSKVILTNVEADNGMIHAIDTVILGPWPRVTSEVESSGGDDSSASTEGSTIVEIAISDDRFETLVAAVVAAGLVDTLSSGEYTVFAPTDDAFAKLGLNENNIATAFTKAELTDILLYHVIGSKVDSDQAAASAGDVTMANGSAAGIKLFEDDIYINDDSKVIIADIVASNGVIHAVDTVILGPWPKTE